MAASASHLRRVRRGLGHTVQQHRLSGRYASISQVPGCSRPLLGAQQPPTARHLTSTRVVTGRDSNEAMLMQQMMDAMSFGDDEEDKQQQQQQQQQKPAPATLPVKGTVLDVKNNIASISGLRNATLGSVVTVYNRIAHDDHEEGSEAAHERLCRGVVLYLERKVAHVALFREGPQLDAVQVQIGMEVHLEDAALRVPMSVGRLAGRAVNPLGELITDISPAEEVVATASDLVSIAWGSTAVPSLMARAPLREPFTTGILAIDCFKPLAFGHRFGVLGPRNSGKTRLMLDMISQQVKAALASGAEPPHFVYVCVAKSPLRVKQVVDFLAQTGALPYTTVVSADERDSPVMQYLAPFTGCAIAEYFMSHGKSPRAVVVYDDLATHTTVVESLVQTMKLPRVSQLSLSAHTVLLERSAQLHAQSLTTFALADTPDAATGEVSAFTERVLSIVDDAVVLESQLNRGRVYPPIDVLAAGGSIRGAPFQSVAMWSYMNRVRARINHAAQTKENVDVARHLGLEIEPHDADELEYQQLVRQFFQQPPLAGVDKTEKELGVFVLATVRMALLEKDATLAALVRELHAVLQQEEPELLHLVETHPPSQPWSKEMEAALEQRVVSIALAQRQQARAEQRKRVEREQLLRSRLRPAASG